MIRSLLAVCFASVAFCCLGQLHITVEGSYVLQGYNDVKAPNTDGSTATLFSISEDFSDTPSLTTSRFELSYIHKARHTFECTAAPLMVSNNQLSAPVIFEGRSFEGAVTGSYQFNTYRASYRYRLVDREKLVFDLGLTGLLRDAEIKLVDDVTGTTASNTDLGFVPLVSFYLEGLIADKTSLLLRGDALVGPQGRAEDVFAGIVYSFTPMIALRAGYRIIEGGADVDQVYNFALFHFLAVGATGRF